MDFLIEEASDIGVAVRTARKAQGLRQDDAAGAAGVSESFMVKVENGARGILWDKLFQVLEGLGVRVTVDVPDAAADEMHREKARLEQRRRRAQARRIRNKAEDIEGTPSDE